MIKKRLTESEKLHIKKLVGLGLSLNHMVRLTGKSKTTIYHHFRKIRGRTQLPIRINPRNSQLVGEFIGVFAGDGCFYKMPDKKHRVSLHFNRSEKKYVDEFKQQVLKKIFGKIPSEYYQTNRYNLYYYSKPIYHFIIGFLHWDEKSRKTYSVHLIRRNYPRTFKIGFLRGMLDSDGHLSSKKISFATVSPELAQDITSFLENLDIPCKLSSYEDKRANRKRIYHITIPTQSFFKFLNTVNPRNKKRLNASVGI